MRKTQNPSQSYCDLERDEIWEQAQLKRGRPPTEEGGAVHWHAVAVGHTMSEVFGGNTESDEPEECFYRVGA